MSILTSTLGLANADYTWRREALCQNTDPDLFFPVGTTRKALMQIEQAKQVCRECPVNQACLDYALQTNQVSGIWGGTSEEERQVLRRRYIDGQRNPIPAQPESPTSVILPRYLGALNRRIGHFSNP